VDRLSVVVTGAAAGIGAATVARCLGAGWAVIGVDLDDGGLAALEREHGDGFRGVTGDTAALATHERAAAAAREVAPLGGWVNNAGIDIPGSAVDVKEADLRRIVDVNLIGTALGSAMAVRALVEQGDGGSIVNLSSLQARAAFPGAYAYEASKGGVDALTRQIAVEYGHLGIRANSVQPGAVMTPMTQRSLEATPDRAAELRAYAELHPLNRVAEADEIAAVIAYLLSDDASFVSGVEIPVDGGASARCFAYTPERPDG
jgi:NAD(P)-dependent dehydrogenase (short-subunit alcohol dehydrogenase family)